VALGMEAVSQGRAPPASSWSRRWRDTPGGSAAGPRRAGVL